MKYRRKPEIVQATQWFPGVSVHCEVFTDPKDLVGRWWAHLGHQRELEAGNVGLLLIGHEPVFINAGDWIVLKDGDLTEVHTNASFESKFEAIE